MNFVKRAFLSTKKRVAKGLLLTLILSCICTVVLSGSVIKAASETSRDVALKNIGAVVEMKFNFDSVNSTSMGGMSGKMGEPIPISTIEKLSKLENVSEYNYSYPTYGKAVDFKSYTANGDKQSLIESIQKSFGLVTTDLTVVGTLNTDLLGLFQSNTCKLLDGRTISKDDAGKKVAMIEKRVADINNIQLYDKITIQSNTGEFKNETFEVVGIYEYTAPIEGITASFNNNNPINMIFIPCSELQQMYGAGGEGAISVEFHLKDPSKVSAFINEAQKSGIYDTNKYLLKPADSTSEQKADILKNITDSINLMTIIAFVAGGALLTLIIMLSMKDRKHEMGVLLAIGERKPLIIMQHILELIIPALLSVVLAFMLGSTLSQSIGDSLLSGQIQNAQEQQANDTQAFTQDKVLHVSQKTSDIAPTLDYHITLASIVSLVIIALSIIILATLLIGAYVMRLNPKQMLIKTE